MRYCHGCARNRSPKFWDTPGQQSCNTCRRKAKAASAHRARIKATYGLEGEDYDRLQIAQGGACAGCAGKRGYRLNIDHDHATGLVRGLLCRRCNKVLRDVRDSGVTLRALADYLANPPARMVGIIASASAPASVEGSGSSDSSQ